MKITNKGKQTKGTKTTQTTKSSVFSKFNLNESQLKFSPLGSSSSFEIGNNRKLEHGTTPQLMENASKLLTRDFEMNAQKDFARYFKKSRYTYYAVIQQLTHRTTVDCAVRVVLDDMINPKVIILDFIRTRAKHAGQGLASLLVNFILEGSLALGANIYVTSTKEARSYWEKFGFKKEMNKDVDYALNEFKDCTLLSFPSNSALDLHQFSDESTEETDTSDTSETDSYSESDISESDSSDDSDSSYWDYFDSSDSDDDSSTESFTDYYHRHNRRPK